jgi:hypothetical protein
MMTWAFHDAPADLRPAELVMLLALCDASNDTGDVLYLSDSSQEALARKARMSRRTAQRVLDALLERGLLERAQTSLLDAYSYRVVAVRQNGASGASNVHEGGVNLAHRTSIDGSNGTSRTKKLVSHELPDDWEPNDQHRERAAGLGVDVDREAEAFRAHAASVARKAVRWDAAFTQWLLKARPTLTPAAAAAPVDSWLEGLR